MAKYIGTNFNLPLSHIFWKKRNLIDKNIIKLSSGRCALDFIVEYIKFNKSDEILLPDYLCPEIIEIFEKYRIKTRFYKIRSKLMADVKDIKNKISKNTKALLVIHYFGFPQPIDEIKELCKGNRLYLIEDCAQNLFTKYKGKYLGTFGDMSFNSLRKWMPIPDGSFVYVNTYDDGAVYKNSIKHFNFVWQRYILMLIKSITNFKFYKNFKKLERLNYLKPARMSRLSEFIFKRSNLRLIEEKRKRNFAYLLNNIKNNKLKPLFNKLPDDVCPFGFPILSENRDKLKKLLINNCIYPPIHWQLNLLPKELLKYISPHSIVLSKKVLTVPIDQRYSVADMAKICKVLNAC